MNAVPLPPPGGSRSSTEWAQIAAQAPQLADTLGRYLTQAATFLAPRSVDVADLVMRQLAIWLLAHTDVRTVATIGRTDIEDFKVWLTTQPGIRGDGLSQSTQRQRLRMLRVFFERIIEWDWPDAPARNPIIGRDIPPRPEPLPKFLDDRDAARLMAAARASTDARDRLVVEVLARTGLRAGELCGLDADAVVLIGDGHWLRVPVGKLRNDRYVPLHPDLVTMFADWTAANLDHIRHHRRLVADHRGILDRHLVGRIVRRVARHAGILVHPHQLRHTLATQAINRGMSLEAIAALLGHRSPRMTLVYARISDTTVAEQYFSATGALEAGSETTATRAGDAVRHAAQLHRRLLGNGHCTRPLELDCRFQTICEGCGFYETGPQFVTILRRQRDDATIHGDDARTQLYNQLIEVIDDAQPDTAAREDITR